MVTWFCFGSIVCQHVEFVILISINSGMQVYTFFEMLAFFNPFLIWIATRVIAVTLIHQSLQIRVFDGSVACNLLLLGYIILLCNDILLCLQDGHDAENTKQSTGDMTAFVSRLYKLLSISVYWCSLFLFSFQGTDVQLVFSSKIYILASFSHLDY